MWQLQGGNIKNPNILWMSLIDGPASGSGVKLFCPFSFFSGQQQSVWTQLSSGKERAVWKACMGAGMESSTLFMSMYSTLGMGRLHKSSPISEEARKVSQGRRCERRYAWTQSCLLKVKVGCGQSLTKMILTLYVYCPRGGFSEGVCVCTEVSFILRET